MLNPIPAIDIIEGKCVRLTQGKYDSRTVYSVSPLDMAQKIEDLGFHRLHLVDLDGAKSNHVVNIDILQQITAHTHLSVDFGGGIRQDKDIQLVFDSGADYATIGSLAVTSPDTFEQWISRYRPERIILGADVKDGYVSINGWKESSHISLFKLLDRYIPLGITKVLCTDIDKDGMLNGTSIDLYKSIIARYPQCQLIASGGVSCMQHLHDLNDAGIPYVVFGKAIYEGLINLTDVAKHFLQPSEITQQ